MSSGSKSWFAKYKFKEASYLTFAKLCKIFGSRGQNNSPAPAKTGQILTLAG